MLGHVQGLYPSSCIFFSRGTISSAVTPKIVVAVIINSLECIAMGHPPKQMGISTHCQWKILALVGFPANHEHHRPKAWNAGVVPEVNVW